MSMELELIQMFLLKKKGENETRDGQRNSKNRNVIGSGLFIKSKLFE